MPENSQVPHHIAAIMDGNGRWAASRGLPRVKGHMEGADRIRDIVECCARLGVGYLTLYAFSSENWKRPQSEIIALMKLLAIAAKRERASLLENNVCLKVIGQIDRLPPKTRAELDKTIELTKDNTGLTLILAISYGSREELVDATRAIAAKVKSGQLELDDISNATVAEHLYTGDVPDPDLLIRTSGEMRLSNFLLWQLSYTEIVITQKFWPDFGKEELMAAIDEFRSRHRRYGGVSET